MQNYISVQVYKRVCVCVYVDLTARLHQAICFGFGRYRIGACWLRR